ncbi:MAG: cyclic nucleotide-binding domain-containing protein [Planctomycetota bacterium]
MNPRDLRKTERFHQIPIFSNLAGHEVGQVLKITEEIEVPADHDVFKPGDPPDSFYIVLDGRIEIRLPSENQGLVTIATLSNRSVFGEMSFLGDRPRSAYAHTLEPTRLNRVNGPEFRALLDRGNVAAYKVIYNFAMLISSRLRRVENELLQALEDLGPGKRTARLKELQQFRNTLFQDWSF